MLYSCLHFALTIYIIIFLTIEFIAIPILQKCHMYNLQTNVIAVCICEFFWRRALFRTSVRVITYYFPI